MNIQQYRMYNQQYKMYNQQYRMYNQDRVPTDRFSPIPGFMGKCLSISPEMSSTSVSYTLWTSLKTLFLLHVLPPLILQIKQTLIL